MKAFEQEEMSESMIIKDLPFLTEIPSEELSNSSGGDAPYSAWTSVDLNINSTDCLNSALNAALELGLDVTINSNRFYGENQDAGVVVFCNSTGTGKSTGNIVSYGNQKAADRIINGIVGTG